MELVNWTALITGGTAGIGGSVRFIQADLSDASEPPSNPVPGPPNSAPAGFGSRASPPVPRKPKV